MIKNIIFDWSGVIKDSIDKEKDILNLIKKNNFISSQTIFIGDSNHKIEVGKKVGILTGAVTWGFALEKNLKKQNPDFIIHSMDDLRNIILVD